METTFLHKLASEIHHNHPDKLDKLCFVFPSKRSGLFFKKELAKLKGETFWSPNIVTVDSFIEQLSGLTIIDPLEQLFELYEVHKELNIQPQLSFDRFVDVGKIILGDFNDIDMALADADSLFENVNDFVKLEQWNLEYSGTHKLTQNYLDSFSNLSKYYNAYQKRLLGANKAYQGLIYRYLKGEIESERVDTILDRTKKWDNMYVSGLNALTRAEKTLFEWLTKERGLKIYFEAENQMLQDFDQESGNFLRSFYKKEGSKFKWNTDHLSQGQKQIHTYSLNGNIAMARMVGDLFDSNSSLTVNSETAIILADEGLLMPVLESLPSSVGDVNVTLGFPLGLTSFMSFSEQLFGMQKLVSIRNDQRHFYHKDVMKVITNPILVSIYGENELFQKIAGLLVKSNQVWIEESYLRKQLENSDLPQEIGLMFSDWQKKPISGIQFLSFCLGRFQQNVEESKQNDDVLLEQMYFFKNSLRKLNGYLQKFKHEITLEGVRRIFKHVVSKIQVPFSGEPLAGIQIMGLLETRLLSFKNVVFVSVNEGVFPSKGGFQSFLPFTLRSGFGIQTHQDRESIFAYHFYRILSQAENIHLIYDSSTSGVGSNEKSRFIRQIEHEWPEINAEIQFKHHIGIFEDGKIEKRNVLQKTPEVIENITKYLTQKGLSPSALNTYVESPIDFYYGNVVGIRQPNAVEEDVEHNTFGSIVHECLEEFYIPFENAVLSASKLLDALKKVDLIIEKQFSKVIPNYARGKHYLSFYSVAKYVKRFIKLDIDFLKKSEFPVTLIANELHLKTELQIDGLTFKFGGKADRVESRQGVPHVIDYKTGGVNQSDLTIKEIEDLSG
ncbi:MAG: ATP-dependent helicase/nuclease subunit B, partial [Dokdonia sp.]